MGDAPVTFAALLRFHREILVPEVERTVGASEQRLRDEVQTGFDALAQRLDRLETEYQMLVAGRASGLDRETHGPAHRGPGVEGEGRVP